jgi:hypothetical protein
MSNPADKYIIPKLNSTTKQINTTITDTFCVVGADSASSYDNDTPIIGTSPPLAYSYDGINFIASSNTTLYYVSKVDFNGYQWIAGGYSLNGSQSMLVSSDGINWITPINNVFSLGCISITWGQKKWVAVGVNNEYLCRIAYSYDGMNWTLSTYNNDNHISIITCVAYNGSYFLAGCLDHISKSSDGITWTDVNVHSIIGSVNSITWNGHLWVAVGVNNIYNIAYSENGTTWTPATSAVPLINSGYVVAYNGNTFLAGGEGVNILISSHDGINWTAVMPTINEKYFPGSITDITWNGTFWIVTCATNHLADPVIGYSSDLVNWTSSISGNTLFNDTQRINSITSRNRKNYIRTFC